jgi:YNFM family putative membrane transporter
MLGAAGMFATMYSTQAILPALSHSFGVTPSQAGLTISVVVLALAAGAWIWGPLSDRIGRKRSIVLASTLLVAPTIAAALAPTFPFLLACRTLQGLCMPGLLTVGVPYVVEAFTPAIGGRAMGYYISSLVAGGLIGRVGVALVTAAVGWRTAIGLLAALPLASAIVMRRTLLDVPLPARTPVGGSSALRQLRNPSVLRAAGGAGALFFTFVGVFSYVVYRLEAPPFDYGTAVGGLIFLLWAIGAAGPAMGRLCDRVGWRRVAAAAVACSATGIVLSYPSTLWTLVPGLALITLAMFGGVTAAQLGVAGSTTTDRGVASAVYFTIYYACGALGGYVPGLAWQAWGWNGVATLSLGVLGGAGLALAATGLRARAPSRSYDQG